MIVTRVARGYIFVKDPWSGEDTLPVYAPGAAIQQWWSVLIDGYTRTVRERRIVVATRLWLYMCANGRPFILMPKPTEPQAWPYMHEVPLGLALMEEELPPVPEEEEQEPQPPTPPTDENSIAYAKWYGGSRAVTGKLVSAVFLASASTNVAYFYIQEPGGFRTPGPVGGIKVTPGTGVTADVKAGDVVSVSGTAAVDSGGEANITATSITVTGSSTIPAPVWLNQRATACGAYGIQPSLTPDPTSGPLVEGRGVGPVGCRVRVCGRVTWVGGDRTKCCIDDGSALISDSNGSIRGVQVLYSAAHRCLLAFEVGYDVSEGITGVLGAEKVNDVPVPVVRVPSGVIHVKLSGSDSNDGLSWSTALGTVQAGIDEAAAMQPEGEVWVAAGGYDLASTLTLADGVAVYGGFAGTESARDGRDVEANITTLSGDWGYYPVVTAGTGVGHGARIDGFTITYCGAEGENTGAVYCTGSSPAIANNDITYNNCAAVYCINASPTVVGNDIHGNSYEEIHCVNSSPLISGNTVGENSGTLIYTSGGSPVITGNTLDPSLGGYGGGPWGIDCSGSTAAISDNTITNCYQAAVYCHDSADAAVSRNRISNCARGVYFNAATGSIKNNFVTNPNPTCGSIAGIDLSNCSPLVANNTITHHAAAISVDSSSSVVGNNIAACSEYGLQVAGSGTLALVSNDVYGNTTGYSGIDDPTPANGNIEADPGFAPDGFHIGTGSPCAGAGCNDYVSEGDQDIDGEPRIKPTNGRVDIGADESENCGWHLSVRASSAVAPVDADPARITATLVDDEGDAVSGKTVTFEVVDGNGTLDPTSDETDSTGKACTDLTSSVEGPVTVKASIVDECSDTLESSVAVEFVCWSLAIKAEPAYALLGDPIAITATLTGGAPVTGQTVTFSITEGTGTLDPTSDDTDASGEAHTTLTGTTVGPVTVQASVVTPRGTVAVTRKTYFHGANQQTKVGLLYDLCLNEDPIWYIADEEDEYLTRIDAAYSDVVYQKITGTPFTIDSSFNVVFLAMPTRALQESEIEALSSFVQSGCNKRLVLVGEFNPNFSAHNEELNDILDDTAEYLNVGARFRTQYTGGSCYDVDYDRLRKCHVNTDHYITAGMADPGLCMAATDTFQAGWEAYARPIAYIYSAPTLPWILEEDTSAAGSVVLIHDSCMFGRDYIDEWDTVPEMNFLFTYNLCTKFP